MNALFLSYRRDDTEGQAGRLYADLAAKFGRDSVFIDVVAIHPGLDFRTAIDRGLSSCSVFLAVIGKNWLTAVDSQGRRRLEDPVDFVRLETAEALRRRNIPLIPVLVQGASMPRLDQLPDDLKELAYRNAFELSHAHWASDVAVLVESLQSYLVKPVPPPKPRRYGKIFLWIAVAVVLLFLLAHRR